MLVESSTEQVAPILIVNGVLDSTTYRNLRDVVIKTAMEAPRAVVVDVDHLTVRSSSAWSVFTSARWHVSTWPDVPIILACSNIRRTRAITASGVTKYVPVYPSREAALAAADEVAVIVRHRARAVLPAGQASIHVARGMIHQWLTTWSQSHLIPAVSTVATIFVENVLEHTDSDAVLIVEKYRDTITVAVQDCSHQPAVRHEAATTGAELVSGLAIVSALCRTWGSTPTSSGKTVWGALGSENRL